LVPRQSQSASGIEIGVPVALAGTDFRSVVRLRDQVRQSMLSAASPIQEEFVKPEPMFPGA
jgi:hypothetical protein